MVQKKLTAGNQEPSYSTHPRSSVFPSRAKRSRLRRFEGGGENLFWNRERGS